MNSIKKKIKALLEKTVLNGATEAEALSALEKANELMLKYHLEEFEVTGDDKQKCVMESFEKIKSFYDLTIILPRLTRHFGCEYYTNKTHIFLFGFKQDVELLKFIYNFIVKAALKEGFNYRSTDEYKELVKIRNPKTLVASFIKGFFYRMSEKITALYTEEIKNTGVELVLVKRDKEVKDQFTKLNLNIRTVRSYVSVGSYKSYQSGISVADKTDYLRPIMN